MKVLLLFLMFFVSTLAQSFEAITPQRLLELQQEGVVVIDIRRLEEWQQTGVITGSKLHTFFDKKRNYDLAGWQQAIQGYIVDKNSPIILVCRAANRTKTLASILQTQGYTNLYELDNGIVYGWQHQGLKTVPISKSL